MQPKREENDRECSHCGKDELRNVSLANQQPECSCDQEGRVSDEVKNNETAATKHGKSTTKHVAHYFTSRCEGSVVESTFGWYIGSTCAGLIWKTPGFTTFSR